MAESPNIAALEKILSALGPRLASEMVFTGGAVVELYGQVVSAPPPRVTRAVDCIVAVSNRSEFQKLEAKLHRCGFVNAGLVGESGPLCRYTLDDILLDVMPTTAEVLGFTNRRFALAVREPERHVLPSGSVMLLATFPRFLAIKLETLSARGGVDVRSSHDLEDIVRLVTGRREPQRELRDEIPEVRNFIKRSLREWSKNATFIEGIEAGAPMGREQAEQMLQFVEELIAKR